MRYIERAANAATPTPEDRRIAHLLDKVVEKECVLVGMGAVVYRPGVGVLLGERIGKHATGRLAFPGGHLKEGEEWFDGVKREAREETLLDVVPEPLNDSSVPFLVSNNLYGERHYVTVWILCRSDEGEPQNVEPEKCAGWRFYGLEELGQLVDVSEPLSTAWVPLKRLLRYRNRLGI